MLQALLLAPLTSAAKVEYKRCNMLSLMYRVMLFYMYQMETQYNAFK